MKLGETLSQNDRERLIHRVGPFISRSKDDDARLVQNPKRENLAEVEIECEYDAGIRANALNQLVVRSALEPQCSDVNRFMTTLFQELDGLAARGESPASHRGRRCARLARRDEREYREYLNEEQRSQTGCSAGRMQLEFHHGLL